MAQEPSGSDPSGRPDPAGAGDGAALRLHEERLSVGRRTVETATVRVRLETRAVEQPVALDLRSETVEIERVPVGRVVDAAPPVRVEGDVTILPVVEEVMVVERRLMLKEELRVRRVRSTRRHVETVLLRAQRAVVTRDASGRRPGSEPPASRPPASRNPARSTNMNEETIVAVYDTPAHAELAAQDLRVAGVPDAAIAVHASEAGGDTELATVRATERPSGFWSSLFGGEPDHDTAVYDHSLRTGSTVVTVRVGEEHAQGVTEILESHRPIDIDEHAGRHGFATATATAPAPADAAPIATPAPVANPVPVPAATTETATSGTATTAGPAGEGATLRLLEERLEVGKRVVNRGGARIRRFVVERPVEQRIGLREEHVTMERHAIDDDRPVADPDFSERFIEMTETAEEAVVAKNAYLREEVSLRRNESEHVETIRDTLRTQEAEIERLPAGETGPATPVPPAPKP